MDTLEKKLLLLIQAGIPLVERPYMELAGRLGTTEERVMELLGRLLAEGKIRRLGAVPNHYALGFTANGMTAWDISDEEVSQVGNRLGALSQVTHCYRRPRHRPLWPYNLFAMVHGRTRAEVEETVERIARELDIQRYPHDVIFSTRLLKKTGVRFQEPEGVGV